MPLALRPILLSIPAVSLQIRHLNPLSTVPEMLHFDHWASVRAEACLGSGRGVVRAVGAVRGEGEGVWAAIGRWGRAGVAGIDELVQVVDVVAVAAVEEVAFSGFALGILEGLMLLYVLILVLVVVMVVKAWGLYVLVLRGEILHVLVVGVWVLHVFVLHIRVLLLGLSLISLCLGRLSPEEIFLLHFGDVVAVIGIDIVVAARRCAVDVGAIDAGETWREESPASVLLGLSSYS